MRQVRRASPGRNLTRLSPWISLRTYYSQGEFDKAELIRTRAISEIQKFRGSPNVDIARQLHSRAVLLSIQVGTGLPGMTKNSEGTLPPC